MLLSIHLEDFSYDSQTQTLNRPSTNMKELSSNSLTSQNKKNNSLKNSSKVEIGEKIKLINEVTYLCHSYDDYSINCEVDKLTQFFQQRVDMQTLLRSFLFK